MRASWMFIVIQSSFVYKAVCVYHKYPREINTITVFMFHKYSKGNFLFVFRCISRCIVQCTRTLMATNCSRQTISVKSFPFLFHQTYFSLLLIVQNISCVSRHTRSDNGFGVLPADSVRQHYSCSQHESMHCFVEAMHFVNFPWTMNQPHCCTQSTEFDVFHLCATHPRLQKVSKQIPLHPLLPLRNPTLHICKKALFLWRSRVPKSQLSHSRQADSVIWPTAECYMPFFVSS